jgi:hypothetical protein
MTRLMADLDDPLKRLDDPAFAALRRSAFDRWPLPAGADASSGRSGSDGHK